MRRHRNMPSVLLRDYKATDPPFSLSLSLLFDVYRHAPPTVLFALDARKSPW